MTKRIRGFEPYNLSEPIMPRRATKFSAGYDLHAYINQPWRLLPGRWLLIPTGLTAYMKDDEELQIRPRSGIANKYGITVLNSPGTIDADYYGSHIQVMLMNHSKEDFIINPNDRIAQGVFKPYLITDDDQPMDQIRADGFGHTGV